MFDDVAGKIKAFAQFYVLLGCFGSVVLLLVSTVSENSGVVALAAFLIFVVVLVSSWILYGVGELFEDVKKIKESVKRNSSNNGTELPKL